MSKIIHITHFIDPHCFYFKFNDDLHNTQLQCLEDEISKYARTQVNKSRPFTVKEGDIVAAYEITWAKWVRAVVRTNLDKFERCQLWAIDHGKEFHTVYKNVIPLPEHLIEKQAKWIHRGSIYGVSPARPELNLDTLKKELNRCENWSEKAINQIKYFLSRDDVLKVLYDIKHIRNNYYFGDVSIEAMPKLLKSTVNTDFGNALIAIDEAINVDFQKEMDRIALKYDTPFDKNLIQSDNDTDSGSVITVVSNRSSIRQKLAQACALNNTLESKPGPSIAPSKVGSTVVASEINGGLTRMQMSNRLNKPPPSVVASTVVPSEINGGTTRMNMNHMQNRGFNPNYTNGQNKKNGNAHMPAGFERDSHRFDKHNNRFQ